MITLGKRFLILFLVSLGLPSGLLAAQAGREYANKGRHYWYMMEEGKRFFREGAYGDAIIAFEDARNERHELHSRMERDLIALLSFPEVRRMRDSLDLIEVYITERNQYDARAALDELYYRVGKGALQNSAERALTYLDRLKNYPEADYWIAESYRMSGENSLALKQYHAALERRDELENPAFAVEIQYKIAKIERDRQQYNEMKQQLASILELDGLWAQDDGSFIRQAMARTLNNEGINRFLTMYRHKNTETEQAHRMLGFYYYQSGQHGRAVEHLVFSFLIQNTVVIDEIIAKEFDFKFTNPENLIGALARRPTLLRYLEEAEYFRTCYFLADALYATGSETPARELWSFLARQGDEAGEWGGRARSQLRQPFIESPAEMP
jgi:tetratricopeptide (TPR) repeat protein